MSDFNLCHNLKKKSLLKHARVFHTVLDIAKKKKKLKISNIKLLKGQKILKNQKIHYLEIVETKHNIYDYTIKKNKRKMGQYSFRYCQKKKKNNTIDKYKRKIGYLLIYLFI